MTTERLQSVFESVCQSDGFASYREMEPLLGEVACAVAAGWQPTIEALRGPSLQRAGYLIEHLSSQMCSVDALFWQSHLNTLHTRASATFVAVPFFHRDVPDLFARDELATHWGLSRGLDHARLKQLLRWPHVA